MTATDHLLVPVDFSDAASNALIYAFRLADATNHPLYILHVVYPQMESFDFPIFSGSATKTKTELAMIALKEYVSAHLADIQNYLHREPELYYFVKLGSPIPVVCDFAEEHNSRLVIMGTEGKSARKKKFLGSVTAGILARSPSPILSIPPDYTYKGLNQVGFASDFFESDVEELKIYASILSPLMPVLHFVHIQQDETEKEHDKEQLKKIQAQIEDKVSFLKLNFQLIQGKDVHEELMNFIEQKQLDLIAMYKPERPWYKRLFKLSVSKEMVLYANIPVLVFRPDGSHG